MFRLNPRTVAPMLGILLFIAACPHRALADDSTDTMPSKLGDTWTNSLKMTFTYIPAGEFIMGYGPPGTRNRAHHVTITKPFLMGITHVTVAQFRAFVADTGFQTDAEKRGSAAIFNDDNQQIYVNGNCWKHPGFAQDDDHPVVDVSWNDVHAFVLWLIQKDGKAYHLPTEAQWEYACRAGTTTTYYWGDNPDDGAAYANCMDKIGQQKFPHLQGFTWSDGFFFTSPVKSFKPNPWGLYDMIGDACCWVKDTDNIYGGDAVDPLVVYPDGWHILRGGSWAASPDGCTCAFRGIGDPSYGNWTTGFRIAMDLP
jgi:sulfatase modifying factor 1